VGVWAGLFPGSAVVASPARTGPNGGPQGGVAILVPTPHTLLRSLELVPGCGVAAWIRTGEVREVMVLSIYLPPDDRVNVLRALQENFPPSRNCPVFLAGDINFQADAPRSVGERELASTLNAWLMQLDLLSLVDFPTHASDGRLTSLDLLAVPAADAPLWGARPQWHLSMSDHALLLAGPSPPTVSAARACTPFAIKSLPSAALAELRRLGAQVETLLGIPSSPVKLVQPPPRPRRVTRLGIACRRSFHLRT
jgi:hypothetical protein